MGSSVRRTFWQATPRDAVPHMGRPLTRTRFRPPGDVNGIEVGANSNIQDNAIVHVSKYSMDGTARPTVIGNNVTIGEARREGSGGGGGKARTRLHTGMKGFRVYAGAQTSRYATRRSRKFCSLGLCSATAPRVLEPLCLTHPIPNPTHSGHAATVHACTIEDNCLVGMGATVLDGATVRERGGSHGAGRLCMCHLSLEV